MMKMVLLSAAQPLLAQQPAQPGGGMTQILFLGLMFAAMYFLMIAPQRPLIPTLMPIFFASTEGDMIHPDKAA